MSLPSPAAPILGMAGGSQGPCPCQVPACPHIPTMCPHGELWPVPLAPTAPQGEGLAAAWRGTLLPLLPQRARVGNNRATGFPFESRVGQGRAFGGQSAAVSPVCTHEADVTRPPRPRYKSWWVQCTGTGSLQQLHPTAMSSAPASRSWLHPQGAMGPARLCLLLLLSAPATAPNPGIMARLTPRALEFGESHAPEHLWGVWAGGGGG